MNSPPSKIRRATSKVSVLACIVSLLTYGSQTAFSAEPLETKQLREELRQRDSVIADLLKRVAELERRMGARQARSAPVSPVASATPQPEPEREAPSPVHRTAQRAVAGESKHSTAPGAVEVDELAAERALERTLTAEGVLLLPAKAFEIEPFFTYARRVADTPILVAVDEGILVRSIRVRRNEFDVGIRTKFGLPYDSQLELTLPYRIVEHDVVTPVGLSDFDGSSATGTSLGDIKLGVAKTLVRERGWRPDLVGRVTWDTDTGDQIDDDVVMGIGFNELQVSLSALKRQDPIAFTGSLSYETTFEKDGVEPGDEFGISLGASLAASPQTSLSTGLAQTFIGKTKVDGRNVSGSDRVSGVLLLGASTLVGRNSLLSLTAAVGLTDDAPDYAINLSLPMRF